MALDHILYILVINGNSIIQFVKNNESICSKEALWTFVDHLIYKNIHIYVSFIVMKLSFMGVSISCFGWLCGLDPLLVAKVTNHESLMVSLITKFLLGIVPYCDEWIPTKRRLKFIIV